MSDYSEDIEVGEFHWRNGIFFKRLYDGSVRLRIAAGGLFGPQFPIRVAIPPNEWASIVAAVSAPGSTAEGYAAATQLHGPGVPEVPNAV